MLFYALTLINNGGFFTDKLKFHDAGNLFGFLWGINTSGIYVTKHKFFKCPSNSKEELVYLVGSVLFAMFADSHDAIDENKTFEFNISKANGDLNIYNDIIKIMEDCLQKTPRIKLEDLKNKIEDLLEGFDIIREPNPNIMVSCENTNK